MSVLYIFIYSYNLTRVILYGAAIMSKKDSKSSRYYRASSGKPHKHNTRGYDDEDDDESYDYSNIGGEDGFSKVGEDCKNIFNDLKDSIGDVINSTHSSHGVSKHKSSGLSIKKIKKNITKNDRISAILLILGAIGIVLLAGSVGITVVVVVLIGLLLYLLLS